MKRLKKVGNKMNLIYALEEFPKKCSKSIFLAGPTPRNNSVESWRKDAIKILQELNYDGVVFIPEPRNGDFTNDYSKQIEWETQGLNQCDCILFWIPRDMKNMPALTTNIEWGKYQGSEKVVMGFPEDAEHVRYIKYECDNLKISVNNTLEDTIKSAIEYIGEGAYREDGECSVPLIIWNTQMFKDWYDAQKNAGNVLEDAKVNYIFKMPKARKVFLWVLYVKVFITAENRYKENEFVVSRTDVSSIVIYKKDENDIMNSDIVLVEEFRSPVRNEECMVYEIPGGSSISDKDSLETVCSEITEETGLKFSKDRIIYETDRQLMATLSSHKCFLYSLELTDDELEDIKLRDGETNGVEEDTELTYLRVYKLKDIMENTLLDWSNIGFILYVLNKH